jgi:hypothetical protein
MKSGLSFLIAARQCEIDELDQLARTSELVGLIGRLVHALQRERGMSNVFLASQRHAALPSSALPQIAECLALEQEVRAGFDQLDTEPPAACATARACSAASPGCCTAGRPARPAPAHRRAQALTPAQSTRPSPS